MASFRPGLAPKSGNHRLKTPAVDVSFAIFPRWQLKDPHVRNDQPAPGASERDADELEIRDQSKYIVASSNVKIDC